MVYIQKKEYLALKRNEILSHEKTCILLSERSQSERVIYCLIPTIWHFGKGKAMETIKRSVVARGWGGWIGWAQRNFKAVELFSMILQWWMHVIIYLSKPIEYAKPRVNPNVNYGLWVIMMYQCSFINCNKCTCHSSEWCW